ncbi:MAG: glycoside hydrolase family 88 protein [bacterium]|nr:glycoside hydrolase family 88 protein [bacterium]
MTPRHRTIFRMNTAGLALAAAAVACAAVLAACRASKPVPDTLPWSVRMTESVLRRSPDPANLESPKKPYWEYTYGLVLKAVLETWAVTGDGRYFEYVRRYYDQFVGEDGSIRTYRKSEYNIDRINPGKPLFRLYRETGNEKFRRALDTLRSQMATHPRTSEGGFWHKNKYPHQMWLDGIYMASPFLAQYGAEFDEPGLFDEAAKQVLLMERVSREEKTGLLYHGWDESREQKWADPNTGLSSQFWGRSMGWYAMAVVDVLDFLPADHPRRPELTALFTRLATAVANVQDPETGLWYQVLDQGTRKGNYPESSASCMFVYALAKGARTGVLHPAYRHIAEKGYRGILERFIRTDRRGWVSIDSACAVAGLGGDPYRDGSYEYYIGEKIRTNDPKAVGPFILASLEMEKAVR